MKAQQTTSPFEKLDWPEQPLRNAPLKRAIVQIRFLPIPKLSLLEYVAQFQDQICSRFPIQNKNEFHFNVEGQASQSIVIWSFQSLDQKQTITLSQEFLAFETLTYSSRENFIENFRFSLNAFESCQFQAIYQRLGMRYLNQIPYEDLNEIKPWVHPQTLGFANDFSNTFLAISENIFQIPNAQLLVKCGLLPQGLVHDPQVLQPLEQKSWILDLDCYSQEQALLMDSADNISAMAYELSKRIYSFFRWALTDRFIEENSK